MSDTQHFGRIVREYREKPGLTLKQTAELCGMSEKGLEQIELGDSDPKLSNVLSIAYVFKLDPGALNRCVCFST